MLYVQYVSMPSFHPFAGDKEYNLPRVEPIKVPELSLQVGNSFKMKMKQVQISGIGNSDVQKVRYVLT